MRDHTNLAWPEGPFGADQRPFGRRERILMALALELDDRGVEIVPVAAAAVYLRTRRAQTFDIRSDTLNVGFRVTTAERSDDVMPLLDIVDRALVRGRRHAVVLAGHGLGRDLSRLPRPAERQLPGVVGVGDAWIARGAHRRGMAAMIDTREDVGADAVPVDVALQAATRSERAADPDLVAACCLARCIAVAVVAGVHAGAYRLEGRFSARQAAEMAAWDQLERVDWSLLSTPPG